MRRAAGVAGVTLVTIACMVLPYLPGSYDAFAVALSGAARILFVLAVWSYIGWRWLRHQKRSASRTRAVPLYLMLVPSLSAVFQFTVLPGFAESARGRAMQNSAPVIAAIETHRQAKGRYA